MTRPRLPASLAGQMALLIGLALFVAQAINLGLVLQERAALRLEQSTGPTATRIADGLERETAGRAIGRERGRVRRLPANPIPAALTRRPEVAAELARRLAAIGVAHGRIDAATGPMPERRLRRWRGRPDRPHHPDRIPAELVVAVEQPGRGWLVVHGPWPEPEAYIVWRLIAQTLILYVVILLPVLWISRRISRPLHALALATRTYVPGHDAPAALPPNGPADVRAVTAGFNALTARVAAMLEEKDRMLGAIGHDLRTPLASLRVRIESVEDDDDRARMAETIAEMNRTLDDILSLARLGRPSEAATEVDLSALVDAVAEDFRDLGHAVATIDSPRILTRLRPTLFRRAVRNLIENAVKYAGAAEVAVAEAAAGVAVTVADRGPGIPEDRLASVFAPFTRLETSRNRDTGGIGLGLALAQAIVHEAGGEIALANRAGGGLEARITLPR